MSEFIASGPFEQAHPNALAVYCSDGRFTDAVEQLVHKLGFPRLDTLTIPGGPGLLELTSGPMAAVETVRTAVSFLIDGHKIEHAVLIAHSGCGYYRNRFAYDSPESMLRRQLADLNAAERYVRSARPGIEVSKFYAKVQHGQVAFEAIG
jgi:hypothetical protein